MTDGSVDELDLVSVWCKLLSQTIDDMTKWSVHRPGNLWTGPQSTGCGHFSVDKKNQATIPLFFNT